MRLLSLLLPIVVVLATACAGQAEVSPPGSEPTSTRNPNAGPVPRPTEQTDALDVRLRILHRDGRGLRVAMQVTNTTGQGLEVLDPTGPATTDVDPDGVATTSFTREPFRLRGDEGPFSHDTYGIAADAADHVTDEFTLAVPDEASMLRVCVEVLSSSDDVTSGEDRSATGYRDGDGPAPLACSAPVEPSERHPADRPR